MESIDLNLLVALDALLTESSVTKAARRLGLSSSAMSRTLARLRSATGDPLLVRAGRGLAPTPHAAALRDRVRSLNLEAHTVLRPAVNPLDVASLKVTFTLRAGEWFMERIAAPLVAAIAAAAPRVRLRFAPKPDKDSRLLREGLIDLEIGVSAWSAPEVRTRLLFRDEFVGVARIGHPLLAGGKVTPERYAACHHVMASPQGDFRGPVDEALEQLGHRRTVVVVVPGYPDAMRVARTSELVASVPRLCLDQATVTDQAAVLGLKTFDLPIQLPTILIAAMWHPRMDADPAHRWLRGTVIAFCTKASPGWGN